MFWLHPTLEHCWLSLGHKDLQQTSINIASHLITPIRASEVSQARQSGHLGVLDIRQELRGHRLLVLRHGYGELALLDVVQPPGGDEGEGEGDELELY